MIGHSRAMTGHSRAAYRSVGWFILLLALGAFLRLETLNQRPLWYDEIYTSTVVSGAHSFADIWAASGRDRAEHPSMYYGAAFAVSRLSSDDTSIRIPACLAGLLSIPGEVYEAADIDGAEPLRRLWSSRCPSWRATW